MTGLQALIVRGFEINAAASAIGKSAVDLQLNTANSALIHPLATESGSIFFVPSGTDLFSFTPNDQLQGSFTASSVNYVGIDLRRSTSNAEATATVDTAKFLDPSTTEEISRQVPLGKILYFVVVVSTVPFDNTPSICPIAKITTNGSNVVTTIEDCRYRPSRLATGGSFPDVSASYSWPQGREENTTGDVFYGGDKAINSYKEWQDALMSRVWEIGGGKYWYSPTADRNIRMTRGGTAFSNGEWFEYSAPNLHWRGLKIVFDNSGTGIYYNTITDQLVNAVGAYGTTATDLADGDCIYVDITRNSNATIVAIKGQIATLGTPTTPGSRYILAWRVGAIVYSRDSAFPVGTTFPVATTATVGIVKLSHVATTPLAPIVLSDGALNAASGVVGLDANIRAAVISTTGDAIIGTSGAGNGNGIAGVGNGTGVGGKFTGSATGGSLSLVQSTSNTNTAAIASVKDSAGNLRNVFDHVGYMTGRYNRIYENWNFYTGLAIGDIAVPIAKYPNWSATSLGGGALDSINPTSTYPATMIQILNSAAGNDDIVLYSSNAWIHSSFTGLSFVMEWEASTPNPSGAGKTMFMGLSNSASDLNNSIGFYGNAGGILAWRTRTAAAGVATSNVGVTTLAANEIGKFRIELYGSATVFGATTVKFYVNSVLQNTHTTNIPASILHCMFKYEDDGAGVASTINIGPIVAYWNRYLTLPSL